VNLRVVSSRLLPLVLATAALAAGTSGRGGLALWLGLLTGPAAAAAAFVAVSDALEGRPARLQAATSGVALALVVLASASRANAPTGAAASPLATWALALALLAYGVPLVAWVLEPVRVPRRARRPRRLHPEGAAVRRALDQQRDSRHRDRDQRRAHRDSERLSPDRRSFVGGEVGHPAGIGFTLPERRQRHSGLLPRL